MVEISLVAFDLDGTLLDSNSQLRPDVRNAVVQLQQEGTFVTLVTGRSFSSTAPIAEELGVRVPFGVVHGALVRDLVGLEIVKRVIPEVGVHEALDLAVHNDCVPIVVGCEEGQELAICEEHRDHPIVHFTLSLQEKGGELRSHEPVFFPRREIALKAFAIYAIGLRERISSLLAETERMRVKIFNAARFPVHAIEADPQLKETHEVAMLTPIGADKRTALEAIAETLGASMKDVLAFGDWHNDVPMLQAAGHAVLMGNAPSGLAGTIGHPNLVRTGHHDGSGIVDGLARFGLI
jgi:HMP-PP phosphatase